MASCLPCVVSRIRGHVDLIDSHVGELFYPCSIEDTKAGSVKLFERDFTELGEYNKEKINVFSIDNVLSQMRKIYENRVRILYAY